MSEAIRQKLKEAPEFKCHKVVRAAKIRAIAKDPDWTIRAMIDLPKHGSVQVDVTELAERTQMNVGGYLVLYHDGYVSYSPELAFKEGYTLKADMPELPDLEAALVKIGDPMTREQSIARTKIQEAMMWLERGNG